MGGIAAAARLARLGYQVTVVEKGTQAGGRCDRLVRDGHCFDTGPTLFLMPEIYGRTYADLGERIEDHLDLRRVDPGYHVHFDDGTSLTLTSDLCKMQAQLEAIEPGSFGNLLRYLDEGGFHYKLAFPHLIERNFYNLFQFFNPKIIHLILKIKLLTKHFDHIGGYFCDIRLKAAFTFQDMYLSLSPYEAAATYSLIQYAELVRGVWFPIGGMARIVETLTGIAEANGCKFLYGVPVEQINVQGRQATGVTLSDGRTIRADIVVANADLPYVYGHLLPKDGKSDRLERKKYSCSTVTFYWGVDKQYPQISTHNAFLSTSYRKGFEQVLEDLTLPDRPSFYAHTPVRVDPTLAPEGQDSLMVVVPVGHINDDAPQEWDAIRNRAREIVLERLAQIGVHDLIDHIKFEVSYTPSDWQDRYNLTKGSNLGLAHNLMQMGYLRPHNRHVRYRNLYFVGASTHPGNGVATALISAKLATERILRDAGAAQPVSS
jgi:phytoene desaturase